MQIGGLPLDYSSFMPKFICNKLFIFHPKKFWDCVFVSMSRKYAQKRRKQYARTVTRYNSLGSVWRLYNQSFANSKLMIVEFEQLDLDHFLSTFCFKKLELELLTCCHTNQVQRLSIGSDMQLPHSFIEPTKAYITSVIIQKLFSILVACLGRFSGGIATR